MADDKLAAEREHDKRILITIVTDIRAQLEIIVFQRPELFRAEFRPYFPGPWRDVEGRLTRTVHSLERDDLNWEYLENAGLVRDSLQFKRNSLIVSVSIKA